MAVGDVRGTLYPWSNRVVFAEIGGFRVRTRERQADNNLDYKPISPVEVAGRGAERNPAADAGAGRIPIDPAVGERADVPAVGVSVGVARQDCPVAKAEVVLVEMCDLDGSSIARVTAVPISIRSWRAADARLTSNWAASQ